LNRYEAPKPGRYKVFFEAIKRVRIIGDTSATPGSGRVLNAAAPDIYALTKCLLQSESIKKEES